MPSSGFLGRANVDRCLDRRLDAARFRRPSDVRQSFLVGLQLAYPSRRHVRSSLIMKASTCLLALAVSLLINTLNASEEPGVLFRHLQYLFASRAVEGRCYMCI